MTDDDNQLTARELEILRMARKLPRPWQNRLYYWLKGMTEE